MGVTNKGKHHLLDVTFRGTTPPTNYYVALVDNTTAPTADTNTLSQLTEVTGAGYTSGGVSLSRNSTDFDTLTENDTNDRGEIQIKDVSWTGVVTNAYHAVLTDDNGTVGSREVYAFWALTGPITTSAGQTLTLQDCEIRLTE